MQQSGVQKGLTPNASKDNLSTDYNYEQQQAQNQNQYQMQKNKIPKNGVPSKNQQKQQVDMYNPSEAAQSMLPGVGNERQHAPHRIQQNPNYNPQNMAYVNISSDGAKAVGPIGLKRAEKELIMRRYKNPHYQNDSINRVALIYGQQNQHANSYDR